MYITPAAADSPMSLKAGIKSSYTSGMAEPNLSWWPFVEAGIRFPFLEVYPGASRVLHYQLTDGLGAYEYTDYSRLECAIVLLPAGFLSLEARAWYGAGIHDFMVKGYSGEATMEIASILLGAAYAWRGEEYEIDSLNHETEYTHWSAEVSYFISDILEIDVGFEKDMTEFSSPAIRYNKNVARIGTLFRPHALLYCMGGFTAGRDSAEYTLFGADVGIDLRVSNHVKFSAVYVADYYRAPPDTGTSSGSGHGPGTTPGSSNGNPFLQTSLLGKSYWAQHLSLELSMRW